VLQCYLLININGLRVAYSLNVNIFCVVCKGGEQNPSVMSTHLDKRIYRLESVNQIFDHGMKRLPKFPITGETNNGEIKKK